MLSLRMKGQQSCDADISQSTDDIFQQPHASQVS